MEGLLRDEDIVYCPFFFFFFFFFNFFLLSFLLDLVLFWVCFESDEVVGFVAKMKK